jgi:hypothetical protein
MKTSLLSYIYINSSDSELKELLDNYKETLRRESEVLTEPTKILLKDKINEITQELLERNY